MKAIDKKRQKSKIQVRRLKPSLQGMEIDSNRILATSISRQFLKRIPTPPTTAISKTYQ